MDVLLVLQDGEFCQLVGEELNTAGFSSVCVHTLDAALDKMSKEKFEVIVADLQIGESAPKSLLDVSLKANKKVIFLTDFPSSLAQMAIKRGADCVFEKPFRIDVLLKRIKVLTQPPAHPQNRTFERFDVEYRVSLSFFDKEAVSKARVMNLSQGGMFVVLEDFLPITGTECRFRIESPKNEFTPIRGKAAVRWSRPHPIQGVQPTGCGLQFSRFEGPSFDKLLNVINRLKTQHPSLVL